MTSNTASPNKREMTHQAPPRPGRESTVSAPERLGSHETSRHCQQRSQFTFPILQLLLALAAATAFWPLPLRAQDVVIVSATRDRSTRLVGEIVELTGAKLVFRHASGREETITGERVIDVKSSSPLLREADAFLQQHEYSQAHKAYRAALVDEKRAWMRRRILVRLVWASRYLDRIDQAGTAFRILYQSDSTTRDFAAIPLAWTTVQPPSTLEQRARQWLADKDSAVARLMGASWLLSTSSRAAAVQSLQRLMTCKDSRVVFLAEAQLWRTRLATAGGGQVARWQARVDRMPVSIRAGPLFLLAAAQARNQDAESAGLTYMRIPILYPRQRRLSGRSLLAAAGQLERMGRTDEARGLYREVILEYPDAAAADQARREFERLQ